MNDGEASTHTPSHRQQLVVDNCGAVLTMEGPAADPLGIQTGISIFCQQGRIAWMGAAADLPAEAVGAPRLDAKGRAVLPGLVDCHTHLLFGGSRAHEFALRSEGATYAEIMEAGGGIRNTMGAVRQLSREDLVALCLPRLDAMLARGVTAVEVKSGYGLDVASELKSLEAINDLNAQHPMDVHATCLAAHVVPPEFEGRADAYASVVAEEILPEAARRRLATAADVFIEAGAFTPQHGRRILSKAKDLGLGLHVHAEQLSRTGGAALAAELGALSAGHLEFASDDDLRRLAEAGVVCEALCTAQVFLGMNERVPGRQMIEAGARVAVATDYNPGSANSPDLHLAAGLAVTMGGLTAEQALLGITRWGAEALGLVDAGRLSVGARADLVVLNRTSPWDVLYEWSTSHVAQVVVGGEVVVSAEPN